MITPPAIADQDLNNPGSMLVGTSKSLRLVTGAKLVTGSRRTGPFLTGTCHRDAQSATVEIGPIETANRLLRFRRSRHRDESKSARLSSGAVLDEGSLVHGAGLGEEILNLDLGGVEGKISYV